MILVDANLLLYAEDSLHLAALAIEHGCELASTDYDFARFPKLKWRNPPRLTDIGEQCEKVPGTAKAER